MAAVVAAIAALALHSARAPVPPAPSWFEPALPLDDVVNAPGAHRGRRVVARGRYDLERSVFVLGSFFEGRRGAQVYTPLQISESGGELVLLVDRGWIPENEIDTFVARDGASSERAVYGAVVPEQFGAPSQEAPPTPQRRRRSLRPSALQAELPYPLLPLILAREAGSGVELPLAAVGAGPPPARLLGARGPFWLGLAALGCALVGAVLRRRAI